MFYIWISSCQVQCYSKLQLDLCFPGTFEHGVMDNEKDRIYIRYTNTEMRRDN